MSKLLALALPPAAALGANLPGIGPVFVFRILTLIVALVALSYPAEHSRHGLSRPLATLAVLWVGTGVLLTLVAIDGTAAVRTMTSVSLGLLLAVACVRIVRSEPRFLLWSAQGWLLSFVITSAIAFWELSTGQHLSSYYLPDGGPGSQLPAASFFNPNAFALYLVCIQAILLWFLGRTRRLLVRVLMYVGSIWCAFLIMATGSRLCIAAFVLLTIAFLALHRMSLTRALLVAAVIGGITWSAVPSIGTAITAYIPDDVRSTSVSHSLLALANSDTSEGRRLDLFKSAIWLVGASGGIGVSPGNFGAALGEYDVPYSTGAILSPHNFIGELAAEFGLVVLIGYGLLMWSIVRRVLPNGGLERSVLLATGLAFVPASLANSGYLLSSTMWAFCATMLSMVVLAEAGPGDRPKGDA